MLLSWVFISSNTTIYFFRKEIYFSECLYFSENDIRMSLYLFWLRKGPSIKYLRNLWGGGGGEGSSKIRTATYKGRGCHANFNQIKF